MLFTIDELRTYVREAEADFDSGAAQLLADLAHAEAERIHGGDLPAAARPVVLEVTARAYRNPEGLASVRIDDYAHTLSAAEAGVYLTDAEARRLSSGARKSSVRMSAYGDLA